MKWMAPFLAYLAVGFGIHYFHNAWGALLGFHTAIIVSLFIAKPGIPISFRFKNKGIQWMVVNILLCGGGGAALYFLWDVFGFASDLPEQVAFLGLNASNWTLFIVYFALVNPFVEECFWRGYLGDERKSLHSSDFLYAGYHVLILFGKVRAGSIIFGLSMLVLAGWFWRQAAREDSGLLAPVLGHMAADLAILFTVYRMV